MSTMTEQGTRAGSGAATGTANAAGVTSGPLPREFRYGSVNFGDPAPGRSEEFVRELLALQYPEIATATLTGPTIRDGKRHYSYTRAIGTKG